MRAPPPNTPPTPRKSNARSGYLPGLHPEFQVSTVSDGYSSAILAALALEKLSFKVNLENSLTVQMVLIGLIAIAWDCRTRGGMGIRFREGTKHWRSIVFKGGSFYNSSSRFSNSFVKKLSSTCARPMKLKSSGWGMR